MERIVTGILAHVDAGKTTLTEALLYRSGTIRNLGRVDNKNAFLDNNAIERERGITVFSKQAELDLNNIHMTIVDTPGHVDFSAEMERTLQILDYAILVISGTDGVQSHTVTLWALLQRYKIPVIVFVNKMDRDIADKKSIMEDISSRLSGNFVDFSCRDHKFIEDVSVCDERLMEMYLENDTLDTYDIAEAIKERKVFPVLFGSALKLEGVDELIEHIEQYTIAPEYPTDFGARIFKIARDEQNERLTYMKITGGTLKAKSIISGSEWSEKADLIRIYSGGKCVNCDEAVAGTVCAVTGLTKCQAGEVLGSDDFLFEPTLEPVISYAIILPDNINVMDTYRKLEAIGEENPELSISWDEVHKEINVKVMGEVQAEIFVRSIKDRLGLEVSLGPGKIVYKETIDDAVEGVGHFEPLRHYAEVHFLIEKGERGSGITYATSVSEDLLAKNWQRLIYTNLMEKRHKGVLIGAELTDVKITLVAGRAHQKHTEGGDFRKAVYRAVRQGLMQAENRILEPYYAFRMELPTESLGRALNDLSNMMANFSAPVDYGEYSVIIGKAPVSTMIDYKKTFSSYTHGLGGISFSPAGYDLCHNEDEVMAQYGYVAESDIHNTADSVFCAHGAGFVVPWYDVFSYMHLPAIGEKTETAIERIDRPANLVNVLDEAMGVEEIDQIINSITGANVKRKNQFKKHHSKEFPAAKSVSVPRTPKEKYILVDGYNVIFAWKELNELAMANIDSARDKLLDIMCNYQAEIGKELIVVFDAYKVKGHGTEFFDFHNIHVVYTKEAQTADAYIERFAHENASKYQITVVTSDGLEQIIIRGAGCSLISSREFEQEVRTQHELTMQKIH